MKRIFTLASLIGLALLPAGCALDRALQPSPDRAQFHYLGDAAFYQGNSADGPMVLITSGTIAKMLNTNSIVVVKPNQQILSSNLHVWGESLTDGIQRVFKAALSRHLQTGKIAVLGKTVVPEADYKIGYFVESFAGPLEGDVVLQVSWWIVHDGKKLMYTSEYRRASGGSVATYVESQRILLEEWAQEVATTIQSLQ